MKFSNSPWVSCYAFRWECGLSEPDCGYSKEVRLYAFKYKFNMYLVYEYPTPHENNVYFEKALGSNRLFKDDENDG